ncbi:protoporphyrinogen oxidase HemJ [Terasakiella sp. A23]|uniref:protoporphyrinogen oxidase HemJ n=1 Tax=Terasakiella sp. FCG-A23 TaxID=3080561 RepID=UPI00295549D3|nr:protoporphyrinogen oxidase HemJ [Terasakiella sp. A23]MDV7339886.1 protoporphyrinogen oxidase HemJ [Terasakiella sp. A23]
MFEDSYLWFKALHIISVIAWMAGLFYLPRLYVYHTNAEVGSELSETFKVMERRLLRAIMNPAMISSLIFGILLLAEIDAWDQGWLHVKLTCIVLMIVFHMFLGKYRKDFLNDNNQKSEKFYRMINEVPTLLMILLVIMVVVKPF